MNFQRIPVENDGGRAGGRAGATVYVACVCSVLLVTGLTLIASGGEGTSVAGVPLPPEATCVRVRRGANYAVALVPVGKPTREAEVLFRPDRVVDADPFWLLGTANEQSVLSNCTGSACYDLGLLKSGSRWFREARLSYTYHSAREDESFAGGWLGLKGEMSLLRGWTYWLTATRLCWAPTGEVERGITTDTTSGYLVGRGEDFGLCNQSVDVFPMVAGHESYFLSLTGTYLRENAESRLEERRRHAEAGPCGPQDTAYLRDCTAASSCATSPSVPYRRLLADQNVVLQTAGNEAVLRLESTPSLRRVPGLMDSGAALWIGILRLLLMGLASAVAYVRRSHEASDSTSMLLRARKRINDQQRPVLTSYNMGAVYVDAAIGLLAVASRLAVVIAMSDTLWEDGMATVVVFEYVGVAVSVVHFILRNAVLDLDVKSELPLTKLGGGMALLDSAVAILVSFSDPPAFGSQHVFAGLGRLLATLLLATSGIPLAVFAATTCGVLAGGLPYDAGYFYLKNHVRLLWLSAALWTVELTSVCVAIAHVSARVFAFQLFRAYPGEQVSMSLLLFATVFMVGVPTQNRTVLELVRSSDK